MKLSEIPEGSVVERFDGVRFTVLVIKSAAQRFYGKIQWADWYHVAGLDENGDCRAFTGPDDDREAGLTIVEPRPKGWKPPKFKEVRTRGGYWDIVLLEDPDSAVALNLGDLIAKRDEVMCGDLFYLLDDMSNGIKERRLRTVERHVKRCQRRGGDCHIQQLQEAFPG